MPSSSPAQAKLMRAVAHGWKMPGGGPTKAVATDFMDADMAKQHKTGEMCASCSKKSSGY